MRVKWRLVGKRMPIKVKCFVDKYFYPWDVWVFSNKPLDGEHIEVNIMQLKCR